MSASMLFSIHVHLHDLVFATIRGWIEHARALIKIAYAFGLQLHSTACVSVNNEGGECESYMTRVTHVMIFGYFDLAHLRRHIFALTCSFNVSNSSSGVGVAWTQRLDARRILALVVRSLVAYGVRRMNLRSSE